MGPFKQLYRNTYCNRCGSVLPETGRICPHCHEEVGYTKGPTSFTATFTVVLVMLGIALILELIFG